MHKISTISNFKLNSMTTRPTFFQHSIDLLTIVMKGLGQIMLQENAVTGSVFLIGICMGSWTMGLAALIATLTGTFVAKMLQFDNTNIGKSFYGFSAALVGVALTLMFEPSFIVWIFIIFGSALASILQHFFILKKISVFTLPFVVVTWGAVYLLNLFSPELAIFPAMESIDSTNDFAFAFRGFGQVIFQSSAIAGLLFFCAIFIHTPIAALYGLAASVIAAMLSSAFTSQYEAIQLGLFSFNAVLCAIVFVGNKISDGLWVLCSVILATTFSLLMSKFAFMQLTFPFVISAFITLQLRALFSAQSNA